MSWATAVEARRIEVTGVVQGVGFRPFVAGLAAELGLRGSVLNHARGVTVDIEGSAADLAAFERRVAQDAPPLARVLAIVSTTSQPTGATEFVIAPSRERPGQRTLVPPDTATCTDCLRELRDPADRRFRHPFITCTNCGPRLSIITDIPYDRAATTMADFTMCPTCAVEYADPADRRHHAQPIACHDCGPTLTARDPAGLSLGVGDMALELIQDALGAGLIVAIKGLGGYHLACDATNPAAVHRLRERKRRPDKPFALMVPDLPTAETLLGTEEHYAARLAATAPLDASRRAEVLGGADAPIVVAPRRPGAPVADEVAPGLDELGVMLAYTPVHHLLFAAHPGTGRCAPSVLVMTSGNLGDEPLAFDDHDALTRLGGIADLFLTHDRRIHVPVEDSVVTIDDAGVVPIRRSRGHAPLPVALPPIEPDALARHPAPAILAVGAELKNTCCLTRRDWAFCSAHIGDLGTLESQHAFARTVHQLLDLHSTTPTVLAADLHPGYASRAWAERRAEADGIRLQLIQHHHAHLAALLAEHGRLAERVLGVTFDGTGYGCDGTVWGGEFLLSDGDVTSIERVGHLAPFALPGGEIAVRRPLRIGLALLHVAGLGHRAPDLFPDADPVELDLVASQSTRGGQPVTTSVGRLWDGMAALLGVRSVITFEAQAAIELEVLARRATTVHPLGLPVVTATDGQRQLDTAALTRAVVDAVDAGVDRAAIAHGLHAALCARSVALAVAVAAERDVGTIGLTGGAFANRLLTSGIRSGLMAAGLEVLTHRVVPANDGGLALGQAAIARAIVLREGAR